MVRPSNLKPKGLLLIVFLTTGGHGALALSSDKEELPFDRNEIARKIGEQANSRGIREAFRAHRCEDGDRENPQLSFCEYSFLGLYYRVLWRTGSEKILQIKARTPYNSRYQLSRTSLIGLSLVIDSIEQTGRDEAVLAILDKLTTAERSLSGSASVDTERASYRMVLSRDGYAFTAGRSAP